MASPAPKPTSADEALDILRRLEPVLCHLAGEVGTLRGEVGILRSETGMLRGDVASLRNDYARTREDISEIKGQLKHIPNVWQIIGVMTGVVALAMSSALGLIKLFQLVP